LATYLTDYYSRWVLSLNERIGIEVALINSGLRENWAEHVVCTGSRQTSVPDYDTTREAKNDENYYLSLCNSNNPDLYGDSIKAI